MCMDIDLNDCCGCLDLKTGSFVIGYTGLMFTGFPALYLIHMLCNSTVGKDAPDPILLIFLHMILAFCIIHFIFSSCLIIGLHRNSRGWIKAFLVYMNIYVVLQLISFLLQLFTLFLIGTLFSLPLLMLLIYIFGIVNSYYKQLVNKPIAAATHSPAPAVSNCPSNDTPTNPLMRYETPINTYTAAAPGPVSYGAPNNGNAAAVTGPVTYGAPNNGNTAAVTGPVTYGAPNNGNTAAVTGPVTYGAPDNGYTSAVIGPVSYGAPNNGNTAAVTGPVSYGAPNNVYIAGVTGPVSYGAPNNGYTAGATGPISYGAPNNGNTAGATGPVSYGAPNNGNTAGATGPVSYGAPNNKPKPHVDTRL